MALPQGPRRCGQAGSSSFSKNLSNIFSCLLVWVSCSGRLGSSNLETRNAFFATTPSPASCFPRLMLPPPPALIRLLIFLSIYLPICLQWIGSKLVSWLRRGNNSEEGWSVAPHAIAGLYLRETPDRRLAMMTKRLPGSGDNGGDGGSSDGRSVGGEAHNVEFGAILEGSSVFGVEIEGRRGGQGSGSGAAGDGMGLKDGDLGIEMMELGGELERVPCRSLAWRSDALCLCAVKGVSVCGRIVLV